MSSVVPDSPTYPTAYPAGVNPGCPPRFVLFSKEKEIAGLMKERLDNLVTYELVYVRPPLDERAVRHAEYMGAFFRGRHMVSASLATDEDFTTGKVRNFAPFPEESSENGAPPKILKIGFVKCDAAEPVENLPFVGDNITEEWQAQVLKDVEQRARKARDSEGKYLPIEIEEPLEKGVFTNNFLKLGCPMFARFNDQTNSIEVEILDISPKTWKAYLRPVAVLNFSL